MKIYERYTGVELVIVLSIAPVLSSLVNYSIVVGSLYVIDINFINAVFLIPFVVDSHPVREFAKVLAIIGILSCIIIIAFFDVSLIAVAICAVLLVSCEEWATNLGRYTLRFGLAVFYFMQIEDVIHLITCILFALAILIKDDLLFSSD